MAQEVNKIDWSEALRKLVKEGATVTVKDIHGPMVLGPMPVDYVDVRPGDTSTLTVEFEWIGVEEHPHFIEADRFTRHPDGDEVSCWAETTSDMVAIFAPIYDDVTKRRLKEWSVGEGRRREVPDGATRYQA